MKVNVEINKQVSRPPPQIYNSSKLIKQFLKSSFDYMFIKYVMMSEISLGFVLAARIKDQDQKRYTLQKSCSIAIFIVCSSLRKRHIDITISLKLY
jgi:hypothetical protein